MNTIRHDVNTNCKNVKFITHWRSKPTFENKIRSDCKDSTQRDRHLRHYHELCSRCDQFCCLSILFTHLILSAYKDISLFLFLSLSGRRRVELSPCQSIQSAPPCRCRANWAGADRPQPFSICLVLRRQSLGGSRMQAWRAREWSWLVSARQRWPSTDMSKLQVWLIKFVPSYDLRRPNGSAFNGLD